MNIIPIPIRSSPTPILDSLVHFVSSFQQARSYTQVNKKNKLTEFNPGTAFEPVGIFNMLTLIKSNLSEKVTDITLTLFGISF